MKPTAAIIIGVFTITSAITVPPTWPKKQSNRIRETSPDGRARADPEIRMDTGGWVPIVPSHLAQETREVPTKPIYPGSGKWAKPGTKFKPHVTQHTFLPLKVEDEKPEGHEIFEENQRFFQDYPQKLFQETKRSFQDNFSPKQTPSFQDNTFSPKETPSPYIEPEDDEEDDEEEESSEEFTPTKLYTQVRRTENEEHLPRDPNEDRLREVIKDSKIQTVYTEEGYEDLAYDHAGEEKHAEQNEGQAEFDKEIEKARIDNEPSASSYKNPKKDLKKTMKKSGQEMEITSEIKVLRTPNNGTKTHKYVKIVPKIKRSKRFADEFKVDTDFIDKINHDLPKPIKVEEKPKYPYYNDPSLNLNSPLRYAEDLDNVPKKTEDDLAFYNQADKIQCQEVESDVNPIPERVKNADENPEEMEEATDVQGLVQGPRLGNLGDKIDCFKVKYFGKNPLDSPFFQEQSVGPVNSIFDLKNNPKRDLIDTKSNEIDSKAAKVEELTTLTTPISIITTPNYTLDLKPKNIYDQIQLLEHLPEASNFTEVTRENKSIEVNSTELTPESQALRKRRRRFRPRKPIYNIFDINRYLPPNPYSYIQRTTPKNLLSEVHYKNEIKPSEQLNVFSDVINNIKTSDAQSSGSVNIAVKLNKIKMENIEKTNIFYLTTSTEKPVKSQGLLNEDNVQYDNIELLKVNAKLPPRKRKVNPTTTTATTTTTEESEEITKRPIIGLLPPGLDQYKTIIKPSEVKMNNFYFIGMKPPPFNQFSSYSDYKKFRRRGKRSAQRLAYSDVVRNRNKPIDVDDEEVKVTDDDDYVPHRPKNYHYDENTGKIVYDKTPEPEVEEEYIVVTEAPIPKPTRKSQSQQVTIPKFENFTGPSYVDFIKVLKTNPKYEMIPDPTTTEKEETTTTTTGKPPSTTPPEFLNILAKVKSDESYKAIEDKKKTTTTTTTTEAPEEEETEESQVENVQNSPGGQNIGSNFQIFDINEYLPKVKTYTPRTSIDYSKYKTIERPNLRHNLSSRYNSEEENLEDVKTSRVPILLKKEEDTHVVSESKYEEIEPLSSTTTETTTTTRIRGRTRPRTRRPTSISTTTQLPVTHEKPRRNYLRRRPTRINPRTRSTTQKPEETSKIVQRRSQADEIMEKRESRVVTPRESRVITPRESRVITPQDVYVNSSQSHPGRINPREIKQENITEANETKTKDVQVFKEYDKSKKHGGNYKKEEEIEEAEKEEIKEIEKIEKETTEEESKTINDVKRLTDVVPKPDSFYNDSKLPKHVNQLMEVSVVPEEVLEEEKEEEKEEEDFTEDEEKATKKPVFVKDPSKRLYYYARI